MEKKYLPIGTICDVKINNKKLMIIGYCMPEFNGNLKVKDYVGCAYPEGLLLPKHILTFNHEDITNVLFLGFRNDEQERFDVLLNKANGNDVEKAKSFHEDNEMYLASNNTYSKLLFDENGVVLLAETKPTEKIEFDENGYVINIEKNDEVKNPFHKEYKTLEHKALDTDYSGWNIFNKIEFDEDGTVIEAQTTSFDKNSLNKIEFDENGVVISDGINKEEQIPKYNFDENGTLVSEEKYTFDSNGNLLSVDSAEMEEEVPPIGPGLPGYVEPKNSKTSNYKFDKSGNIVSEETYEFDPNGNLVSVDSTEIEEEVPPIGPGLPGYVEVKKEDKYKFDENGTVVEAN